MANNLMLFGGLAAAFGVLAYAATRKRDDSNEGDDILRRPRVPAIPAQYTCPPGQVYDPFTGNCISRSIGGSCPEGQLYNPLTQDCEPVFTVLTVPGAVGTSGAGESCCAACERTGGNCG